jgi:hypothetical protein
MVSPDFSNVPKLPTHFAPSTSTLIQTAIAWYKTTAVAWYKTRPLYLRILIALIGWPITICILIFPYKWPRRLLVFLMIEGTLIGFSIAMHDDLARTASTSGGLWVPLILIRIFLIGLLPAWLVHRNVKKVRQLYNLQHRIIINILPDIIFFFPGLGLSIYANWRYEIYLGRLAFRQEPTTMPASITSASRKDTDEPVKQNQPTE